MQEAKEEDAKDAKEEAIGEEEEIRVTREMQEDLFKGLFLSEEEIERATLIEQRTDQWHAWRKKRVTGSVAGAAVGHSFFLPHAKLLVELLYPETVCVNEHMTRGTEKEPVAVAIYQQFTGHTVQTKGIFISATHPWRAFSPDGLVVTVDGERILLEVKCPKTLKSSIPQYHYDQVQFGAFMLGCSKIHYFQWTEEACMLEAFARNDAYLDEFLLPAIDWFYFTKLLPRLILKDNGLLTLETVVELPGIHIERFCPPQAATFKPETCPEDDTEPIDWFRFKPERLSGVKFDPRDLHELPMPRKRKPPSSSSSPSASRAKKTKS